jgi:hypothetical protein
MLRGSFTELHAAGCIQTGADIHEHEVNARLHFGDLFASLMIATSLDPCNGCPAYKRGQCGAFLRYNDRASRSQPKERPFQRPANRCSGCGLKIRRPGHEDGQDHIRRAGKKSAAA